jgi:hypothetical protein
MSVPGAVIPSGATSIVKFAGKCEKTIRITKRDGTSFEIQGFDVTKNTVLNVPDNLIYWQVSSCEGTHKEFEFSESDALRIIGASDVDQIRAWKLGENTSINHAMFSAVQC